MLPKLRPDLKIGIIGLGYVGLPLALAFSEKYRVIGYDLDENRVDSLQKGKDLTLQVISHYNISLIKDIYKHKYQLIILAVAHNEFLSIDFSKLKNLDTILFDTRAVLNRE
jgi:UDP-N-acetyl-D-mannosaminuronate dehydrogenase